MGILAWIVVGLIAGWLATQILGGRGGLLRSLALGLFGAIVGGVLFTNLSVDATPGFLGSLVSATVGAILVLLIWRALRRA